MKRLTTNFRVSVDRFTIGEIWEKLEREVSNAMIQIQNGNGNYPIELKKQQLKRVEDYLNAIKETHEIMENQK